MLSFKKSKGFSLIELMIVVGIIGIIAAIGFPSYQEYLRKGRASVAQGDLSNLAQKLETYKQGNFSYSNATAASVYSGGSPSGSSAPDFTLTVFVANNGRDYTLRATPASDKASEDGTYWFNPKGNNCYFPDNNNAAYSPTCAGGKEW